jgi:hypothetical protein
MTMLAYILHIAAGAVGLVSGMLAAFARKGGYVHRRAGDVFCISMLVMAVFAAYLGFVIPGQIVNVFIAAFVCYLVVTAWITVRRTAGRIGSAEKIALGVALVLCAPFAALTFQIALGLPPLVESAMPFRGPIVIAIYVFTGVLVLAALGDARVVMAGGVEGSRRMARHLWRMLLALTLTTGSAFTNGFARMLPGPHHVPTAFFFPLFLPLGLLIFWMIRVRMAQWRRSER